MPRTVKENIAARMAAKAGLDRWIAFCIKKRPLHSALGGKPISVVYWMRKANCNLISKSSEKTASR
jgi:hypothetical protein